MSARFIELGTAQTPACHFTTEVFLREQGKWAVVDATPLKEYEVYYTVDGVPQSRAGHAPPRGQRHDGRRRKDRRMARPEKVSKAAAFEKLPPLCRELSPHGFRDVVDLGLANLVKDARKVGTILDFQETATVRYLVKFKEPKRRGIRTPATIDEYLITVLFDVAPINLCPGDGDTVKDPPVSEEPQRTPEVPIITKDFFVVIIALYPARHITNDASALGEDRLLQLW